MPQHLGLVSLVVQDYDDALDFYVQKLGFRLVEDTYQPAQGKRWVVVSPPGATECHLLLAHASNDHQATRIGDQTGGRVFLFLYTDDFWRDFNAYKAKGVVFVREPRSESYGTVAVFSDLHGNLWDLIQPARGSVQSDAQPLAQADPLRQATTTPMKSVAPLLIALALCGCSGPEHVSPAEFKRQYDWVGKPQTMHDVAYLGQRDGRAFIRVSSMSTVSQKWSDRVIYAELRELDATLRDGLPRIEFKK